MRQPRMRGNPRTPPFLRRLLSFVTGKLTTPRDTLYFCFDAQHLVRQPT